MVRVLAFLWAKLCHTAWLSFSVVVCITDPNYWCGCFFVFTDVATAPLICASDQCSRPRFVWLSGPDCTLSKPSRDMSRGWAHRLVTQSVGMSLRLPTKLYPQSDPAWNSAHVYFESVRISITKLWLYSRALPSELGLCSGCELSFT